MTDAALIYCTAASREDALAIARTVVGERLAACANVFDGMTAVYHWEGRLQQESETVLLLKTSRGLVDTVIDRVRELHRYDCPAIVAWEVAAGHAAFLQWIADETVEADPASGSAG